MSRDIILPGGDTLKLWDSAYPASEVEAILTKALRQPGDNLLRNAYFVGGGSQQGGGQFPLNQRGFTEYIAYKYAIDMWFVLAGGITVSQDSGIILQPNSILLQRVEDYQYFVNKVVTASVLWDDNALTSVTGVFKLDADAIENSEDPKHVVLFGVAIGYGQTIPAFYVVNRDVNTGSTALAAKLEEGPNQTLAHQDADGNWVLNDPPPNKALELLKCQRYFQTFATQSERPTKGADFRPVMRTENPTLGTITLPDGTVLYTASSEL